MTSGWIRCGLDAEGGPSRRSGRNVELNFGSWPWTGSTSFLWTIGAAVPFTRQCGFDLHHGFWNPGVYDFSVEIIPHFSPKGRGP